MSGNSGVDNLGDNSNWFLQTRDAPFDSYAVRGIGPAGLDLVATTITALGPADALTTAICGAGARAAGVCAWVITRIAAPVQPDRAR